MIPKTWKEFCEKNDIKIGEAFIWNSCASVIDVTGKRDEYTDKEILPSEKAVYQHLSLIQLHQLRDCYRQGWKPTHKTYSIIRTSEGLNVVGDSPISHFLSFQTKEIAEEFLMNFRDLIEKAGDLI